MRTNECWDWKWNSLRWYVLRWRRRKSKCSRQLRSFHVCICECRQVRNLLPLPTGRQNCVPLSTGRHARNLRTFVDRSTRSKLDTLRRHARNVCSNFSVYIFIAFYSSAITRVQAIPDHNPSIKSEQKTQQTTCCLAGCIPPQHNADFAEEHRTVKMATGFQVLHWCTKRGQFRRQYHLGLHTPLPHTRLHITCDCVYCVFKKWRQLNDCMFKMLTQQITFVCCFTRY